MSVRAVSIDELTGSSPVVVFTPTIADACLGCGALLAACFGHRGALVVTTLDATVPVWMARLPVVARAASRRIRRRPVTADHDGRSAAPDARGELVVRENDGADLAAPLAALGGAPSSIRALSASVDGTAIGRRRSDVTADGIAELCRALGVRSLLLPLSRHRASRHGDLVEMAAARVCATVDALRCWRYPVGGHGTLEGWTVGSEHRVRTLDTTAWRSAKREALARMDAAGFDLAAVPGPVAPGTDRADRLAGSPERYLRSHASA